RNDESLRVYVLAKLLVALLIDSLLDEADSFSPGAIPSRPVSNWRLTRLLLDVLIDVIKPTFGSTAIQRAWRRRSRHFVLPKRKRIYQRAHARFVAGGVS
ncbi:MAG TPA: hypothetical protein VE010_09895, partial [Thermoanaerobaculia bacterium]|nr:hypothetical protein [Thermoanaerobaculia bacterium]